MLPRLLRPRQLLLFVSIFAAASFRPSQAQTPSAPSAGSDNPILFGTGIDVDGAAPSKGSELGLVKAEENPSKSSDKTKKGEFAAAPIPVVNPTIGNGAGGGVLYARKLGGPEDTSPASAFGGGGRSEQAHACT